MQVIRFLSYWLLNSGLIWIIGQLAPKGVVLGNQHVPALWASVFAGYILSTVNILIDPTVRLFKIKLKEPWQKLVLSIIVNSLGLWVITRLALVVGVGISAFWWAIVLGVILTLGQLFAIGLTAKLIVV